jgi:hypothetical protein
MRLDRSPTRPRFDARTKAPDLNFGVTTSAFLKVTEHRTQIGHNGRDDNACQRLPTNAASTCPSHGRRT